MWLLIESLGLVIAGLIKVVIIFLGRRYQTQYYIVSQRIFWVLGICGTFQIAWHIYGNTFHYSNQCWQSSTGNGQVLWYLMMAVLGTGYAAFLGTLVYVIKKVI